MKKYFVLFFILMGVMVSFAGQQTEEQVTIKEGQPSWLAVMEFTGPYENMGPAVQTYINEFFKQGLIPGGPLHGIYYNSPKEVKPEELKWAFGFSVGKDAIVKEPLKKVELKYKRALVYLHVGPYQKLGEAYDKVLKFATDNKHKLYGPMFDRYLNDPMQTKPEDLKTEIVFPIE
jgi:AraC family transcriptional regulator